MACRIRLPSRIMYAMLWIVTSLVMCMQVCVREREREGEREGGRERENSERSALDAELALKAGREKPAQGERLKLKADQFGDIVNALREMQNLASTGTSALLVDVQEMFSQIALFHRRNREFCDALVDLSLRFPFYCPDPGETISRFRNPARLH